MVTQCWGGDCESVCPLLCSYTFDESLKLLGLEDGFEGGTSDPVVTRGAYLSLTHLRHLKLRQLQVTAELQHTEDTKKKKLTWYSSPAAHLSGAAKLSALSGEDSDLWPCGSAAGGRGAAQHGGGNVLDERSQRGQRGGGGSGFSAVQPQQPRGL